MNMNISANVQFYVVTHDYYKFSFILQDSQYPHQDLSTAFQHIELASRLRTALKAIQFATMDAAAVDQFSHHCVPCIGEDLGVVVSYTLNVSPGTAASMGTAAEI